MKIRNDFVTNSSSSSYIIAYKDVHNDSESTIDKLNNISKVLLDNTDHYETGCAEYFNSIEEVEAYLKDRYYDDFKLEDALETWGGGQRYTREELEQMIKDGYVIAIKEVSYHDELVRDMIDLLDETSNYFTLINSFE